MTPDPNHKNPKSEQEAACTLHHAGPIRFRPRRAVDLMPGALGDNKGWQVRMGDSDLDRLLWDLTRYMHTGCMKISCQPRKSRAGALLYRGRVVACAYGNDKVPEPLPVEPSLEMMLSDLQDPETRLLVYDLPEEVVVSMSALFLGDAIDRNDTLDARSYFDYIGNWLQQKQQTGCVAITTTYAATCLAFAFEGKYAGAFAVDEQKFHPNIQFVFDLLDRDRNAQVSASILSPHLMSASARFGFSLRGDRDAHSNISR
jgi:hypothetical protein